MQVPGLFDTASRIWMPVQVWLGMFPMQTVMLAVVCCSCVLLTPGVDVPREKLQVLVVLCCITFLAPAACVCMQDFLVSCRLCSSNMPGMSKMKAWRRLVTWDCPCSALRLHSRHVQYGSPMQSFCTSAIKKEHSTRGASLFMQAFYWSRAVYRHHEQVGWLPALHRSAALSQCHCFASHPDFAAGGPAEA